MNSINKPKRIFHISDVHIFRNKRHQEHKDVIDNLVKTLIEEKVELVFVGGDVVDSKSRLSPEQIAVVSYFFYNIASVAPIVMIPGNHDIDLKKDGALDSLTPILNNLETKNPIYYLTESGVYNLYDIDWAVWSCIDDGTPTIDKKNFTIGCFHGAVEGCKTESGFTLPNPKPIDDFKDCDIVMLGDIHVTAFFRDNTIVMPGSLLQVTIDENTERGGVLWEWNSKTYIPKFIKIHNECGFKTFNIDDLTSFDEKSVKIPTDKFVVRLLYTGEQNDYSSVTFQEIKKKVKTIYPKADIVCQKRFKKSKATQQVEQQVNKASSKDWFVDFFNSKEVTKDQLKELKALDAVIDKSVDSSDYQTGEYFIEEIQIENFLAFGENNVINFKDIEGIDGLFAPNAHGKSSVLFAIMFCLFNRASKTNGSLVKLINDQMPDGTSAFVQLILKINGSTWRIKRSITPKKTGVSINVEVYETVDGEEVARHEESRPKTDAGILRKLLGDEESFLTLVLFNGNSRSEFANNTNSNRLDLILKFLGISIYDKKLVVVDERIKTAKDSHKSLQARLDVMPTKDKMNEDIANYKTLIFDKSKEIDSLTKEVAVIEQELLDLKRTHKALEVISLGLSLEDAEAQHANLQQAINRQEKTLQTLKSAQNDLDTEIDNRSEEIEELEASLLPDEKVEEIRELIYEARANIKQFNNQLAKKVCITCGKPSDINEEEIKAKIESNTIQLNQAEEVIEAYNADKLAIKVYQELIAQSYSKGQSIEIQEKDIINQKQKLELLSQQIVVLQNNQDKIKEQALLESKISEVESSIKSLNKLSAEKLADINLKREQIGKLCDDLFEYDKREKEVRESESKLNLLTLYKSGMHRTGIPALILQQQIPLINQTLQNYTEDLFDFKLEFSYNDETLDIEFFYPSQKGVRRDVTQASGMEGTVINLIIRAALSEVSLLPKPSLLMLDEIFNTLDDQNLEKLKDCLKRLKDNYQNIVIISHLEDIKDCPDYIISLERENNITTIKTS